MFGDYEAQRHWQEVTYNTPFQEWFVVMHWFELFFVVVVFFVRPKGFKYVMK